MERSDPPLPVFLLTDFGVSDPYVGLMKAVLIRKDPRPPVVDLTHEVSPQNEKEAAFLIEYVVDDLPEPSILLVVVDPDVGTDRGIVAVRLEAGPTVIAPDQGMLDHLPWDRAHRVTNRSLFRETEASTFHGRDRFAPVGRYLAFGGSLRTLGPRHPGPAEDGLLPQPREHPEGIQGEVVYVDGFGNLITNIPGERVEEGFRVEIGDRELSVVGTYGEGEGPVGVVGSFLRLEVAYVNGSARERLGFGKGTRVVLKGPG